MSTDHHHHNHHDHDHHHHHDQHAPDEIPFDEKLLKLLSHWIKHNEDHAINYRNWAEKAKANGKDNASDYLEEAARMSLATNALFEKALAELDDT